MTRNAVCLCTDRNMVVPALYVAAAAARRAGGAYDVYVLAEQRELDDEHVRWMAAHGIRWISGLDFPRLHQVTIINPRLTPAALIRLLMPDLLASRYDRVLYLDTDTEIDGELAPLFRLDLGGHVLAAVQSGGIGNRATQRARLKREAHCRALGMSEPFRYFNSGVMLIDIARWREQGVGERALQFIERYPELCRVAEEDALNSLLDGDVADLSPIWNMRTWAMGLPRMASLLTPVIRHYDGPHKPWRRFAAGRRLFSLESAYRRYHRFTAGTPWSGWLERQWSLSDLHANLRYELDLLVNRLRGRPVRGAPGGAALRKFRKAYGRDLRATPFADVEQGIAVWRDGCLMLNADRTRAADL